MSESVRPAFDAGAAGDEVTPFIAGEGEVVVSLMEALGVRVPKPKPAMGPASSPPPSESAEADEAEDGAPVEPAPASAPASLPPPPAVPSAVPSAAASAAPPPAPAASTERQSILPPPSPSMPPIPDMPASKIGDSVMPPSSMQPPPPSAAVEELTEAALALSSARDAALAEAEEQLLELSIVIAGALVESEIERDPELHGALVRHALDAVRGHRQARLRAAPEAFSLIVDQVGDTRTRHEGVEVEIVEDETLRGLGCVVESEGIRVDGNLAERLREVRRQIDLERQREEVDE